MTPEKTLTLIIRILEECLENEYSAEELRSKIRDVLELLEGLHIAGEPHPEKPTRREKDGLYSDFQLKSL